MFIKRYTVTPEMSIFIFKCIEKTCRRLIRDKKNKIIRDIVSKNLN